MWALLDGLKYYIITCAAVNRRNPFVNDVSAQMITYFNQTCFCGITSKIEISVMICFK